MEKNLLSRDFTSLEYGMAVSRQLSVVGKETFVKPKCGARKRSGGVFAWAFPLDLRKGTSVIKFT